MAAVLKDASAPARPQRTLANEASLVFAVYTTLALAAIYVARQPGTIASVWLANAAAIAFIATAPAQRAWPLLGAAALANLVANLVYGDSLAIASAFVLPNALEIALGAYLVRRGGRPEHFAGDIASFLRLMVAGALVPPLLGASFGAATLQALEFGRFADVWGDWYIGSALGGVAMLPVMLSLRALARDGLSMRRIGAADIGVALAVIVVTGLCFHYVPYPFGIVGVALMACAFGLPRLNTFACALLAVCVLAVLIGFRWWTPLVPKSAWGNTLTYLAALMMVLPAQIAAVVVARQRALAQMLSAVGSRTDDVVVFADMAGVWRWVNQAREAYWGVPNTEVLGRTWQHNVPEPTYSGTMKPLVDAARGGAIARQQVEIDYPVRGRRTVDIVIQPALDEDGRQIGVLSCGTDVTDLEASRRALQATADELRVANQNLEQFVRIASHDLREPLNTVTQFCDLIERTQGHELSETSGLYFKQVRNGAARMKTMLDDVLQFVRLDAEPAAPKEQVSLDALAAEVLAALHARIESSGAVVTVDALGAAPGYRGLLALVLQNFVANAIKFVPPQRRAQVRLSVSRSGTELRLSVHDNGIGIDPARRAELGTPFRRLHSTRKFAGTGLGLAICKRIAEQHQGRLEIESTPGEGSRFDLVIPNA